MSLSRIGILAGAIVLAVTMPSVARAQDTPSAQQLEFFEEKIRPVLVENCYKCHGGDPEKIRGGLILMSRAGVLAGSDSGAVLLAGKPEESLLIQALRYGDPDTGMPPDGKLPDAVIADFVTWIANGAADPRDEATDLTVRPRKWSDPYDYTEGRKHWSYLPMADADPPAVKDKQWVASPVDQFILATLEDNGMQPAAAADKWTLLRRATFDLTGLPPTIEEIENFVADTSPTAYEKVLDRLLASMHYGERWGRHWLDVARYADSNGLDENRPFPNAFRFRDYVIKSFNDDKPYDVFLTEQIAGDIMPDPKSDEERFDRLTGTGFLVLGAKVLAEPDSEKMNMDIVDEQIDVIGKAFMGQTLGCARCHDHKFDPVSTRDYYSMAGIFKSTEAMIHYERVAEVRERELATEESITARKQFEEDLGKAQSELASLTEEANAPIQAAWHNDLAKYLLAATRLGQEVAPREAEENADSNLQFDDVSDAGREIGLLYASGDIEEPFVEWKIDSANGGLHRLRLRLATRYDTPISISIRINGEVVEEALNAAKTSRRRVQAPDSRWLDCGEYDFKAGENVIRLVGDTNFPYLDQYALVPVGEESDYMLNYNNLISDFGLDSTVLDTWIDYLHQAKRSKDPAFAVWHAFADLHGQSEPPNQEAASAVIDALRDTHDEDDGAISPPTLATLSGFPPVDLQDVATRYQTIFATIDLAYREQLARVEGQEAELRALLEERVAELRAQLEELEASAESAEAEDPDAEEKKKELQEDIGALPKQLQAAIGALPRELPDPSQEVIRKILYGANGPFAMPEDATHLYDETTRAQLASLESRIDELEENAPPEIPFAMAVTEGNIIDLPVHIRGDHTNLANEGIPRGFPQVIDHIVTPPSIDAARSGRLELANWLTHPEHPLTARVMVNRIWQWHFGRGIVDSPNNFGSRGRRPSHPDLLDWLARRFIADDWSIKAMHKRIMLSSTYRMSNAYHDVYAEADPESRLLWRMNRRRLEAEPIRDALYAVAGDLDRSMGGGLSSAFVNSSMGASSGFLTLMAKAYKKPRRAVYMPIIRNAIYPMFSVFDYGDPSVSIGARPSTVIAPQALFMMNSPLVVQQSEAFAKTLLDRADLDDISRVELAYLRAYGRPPSQEEKTKDAAFLERMEEIWASDQDDNDPATKSGENEDAYDEARLFAWKNYCHAVIASNEFICVN